MSIYWALKHFSELNGDAVYDLLRLRAQIFVVEQNCAYLDMDELDQEAWHLFGWPNEDSKNLAAYARILKPSAKYAEPSIGRVITTKAKRGTGLGKQLMTQAIMALHQLYPRSAIRINAQQYLHNFYASFGFCQVSEPYLDDGIWHIEMLKPST